MPAAFLIPLLLLLPPLLVLLGIKRARSNNPNLPPSPPKLPIIGNLHQVGSLPHRSLRELSNKYGPLMLLQLGQVPTLVASSREMAQEIMKTHDLIFANRAYSRMASRMLGGNEGIVFSSYGESWKRARKLCVTHLLSSKMVESFRHAKEREVELMIEKISSVASSARRTVVNMTDVLSWFSGNVLFTAISANTCSKEATKEKMRLLVEEGSKLLGAFDVSNFFPMMGWINYFGLDAKGKRLGERWDTVLDEIIDEHADGPSKDEVGRKDTDFVDVLLALENGSPDNFPFTRGNTKAILIDMIGAGVDTTWAVLEWGMAELVRNPKVMKKLQDEVRGAARCRNLVSEEDLRNVTYLKAVIAEVLRLHTPAPFLVPRESSENCQLGGFQVPKKTTVLVNAWAIARDPKVWEEPDEFKPERFINGRVDFHGNHFEFIPFGAGRRICPGLNFAVQTLELGLANLVGRFDWELPGNMTTDDLDMNDTHGIVARKKQRLDLVPKLRAAD